MALQFKIANDNLAKQMGFDYSSEAFLKGDQQIVIINDIGGLGTVNDAPIEPEKDHNFWLVMIFEMEPIKAELFDCDQFIITIDDLVVQLTEALRFNFEDYGNEYD